MKKLTTQEFIDKARSVHGDKYGYENCIYTRSRDAVKITCFIHGDFKQNASSHLMGAGCRKCKSEKASLSFDDFVGRASYIHSGIYKYHRDSYINSSTKTKITCREHGDFHQSPTSHMLGQGCSLCSIEYRKIKKDDFINRCKSVHGGKYDYSKCEYKKHGEKVTITCREHGDFDQLPSNHLSGTGCPECGKFGLKMSSNAKLYLVCDDAGNVKVGVTSVINKRLISLRCSTPFRFWLLCTYDGIGRDVFDTEQYLISKYKSSGFSGFDGASEWLVYSDDILKDIEKRGLSRGQ